MKIGSIIVDKIVWIINVFMLIELMSYCIISFELMIDVKLIVNVIIVK